ncbi:MAG: hypothetical protein M3O70_09120 [Actinomycetota bacterium]|nr:hypothetical protein [Actinomycetota bacterium]
MGADDQHVVVLGQAEEGGLEQGLGHEVERAPSRLRHQPFDLFLPLVVGQAGQVRDRQVLRAVGANDLHQATVS